MASDHGCHETTRVILTEDERQNLLIAADLGISFVPLVSDAKDIQETVTGVNLVTGEQLSCFERILTGIFIFVPVVGATPVRRVLRLGGDYVDEVVDAGAPYVDDAVDTGSEIASGARAGARSAEDLLEAGTSVVGTAAPRATGARTILEYYDFEGAERAYDGIRALTDDVSQIASNTGISAAVIARIKQHVFFKQHHLDDGLRLFDADPEIANAWYRLIDGTHSAKDIQLLKHEHFESVAEGLLRLDYRTAHDAANRRGFPSGLE